jgi:membrane protein implicated in regulation of membrane protease activity
MDWTWLYGVAFVALNNLVLYFWKPWADAYAGEKGKNLARKEDLAAILAEVRAVAIAQKEIDAKISGELWERQCRLNQKRDAYANLLIALNRLNEVHSKRTSRS